ncbi:MAG TPA: NfeD family protein [Mycobacterium sp.]|nr:NfeD family protein [Mycobacterium sp.]
MDAWLIWLIIAVVLLVVEMLTLTVAVGMLGVAALVAAGFAALGLPVFVQLLAFTVTATIGVLLIRPIVRRHMRRPQLERFGIQALVGKPAYVVAEVSGLDGRVRIGGVGGEEWTARPYDQTLVIPAGAIVDVLEISGSTAFVYPRE